MGMTRGMDAQSFRIKPSINANRTLLPENIVNVNPGEKPEQNTLSDTAAIDGSVVKIKRLNKSITGATITLNHMSDDYFYIKSLEEDNDDCEIIYTNESSDRGGEEYVFKNASFRCPAVDSDEITITIEIVSPERTYKRI